MFGCKNGNEETVTECVIFVDFFKNFPSMFQKAKRGNQWVKSDFFFLYDDFFLPECF